MNKKWIVITALGFCFLISWWVVSNTNEINQKIDQSIENNKNNISEKLEAKNLHIVETDKGKKIWELTADSAVYGNDNAKLSNVKGQFYGEDDEIVLNFKAPVGNYVEEKHQLSLNDGAVINHPNEKIFISSETMYWSNDTDNITAEGKVKVVKEGFGTSYGDKTIFSSDFNNIRLEGNTYSELSF